MQILAPHQSFAVAILLGKYETAGVDPPRLTPWERAGLVRAMRRHRHAAHALERAEADGLAVYEARLPRRCGAQRGHSIYIPPGLDDPEADVMIDHERCHHHVAERGLAHATEADVWIATAEAMWPPGDPRPVGPSHWILDGIAIARSGYITKVMQGA